MRTPRCVRGGLCGAKAPHNYCVLCPINADCSAPNTTVTTLRIPKGYWRANAYSTEVVECRAFDGARGSNFRLGAGSYNDPDANVEDSAGATRNVDHSGRRHARPGHLCIISI